MVFAAVMAPWRIQCGDADHVQYCGDASGTGELFDNNELPAPLLDLRCSNWPERSGSGSQVRLIESKKIQSCFPSRSLLSGDLLDLPLVAAAARAIVRVPDFSTPAVFIDGEIGEMLLVVP